jgi:hypothetical protein
MRKTDPVKGIRIYKKTFFSIKLIRAAREFSGSCKKYQKV